MKTSAAPYPEIRNPIVVYLMKSVQNRSPCSLRLLILLQHNHCTFVTILFGPYARLFFNLSMRIRALFPKSASILRLVEQAFWRMPFFYRMNWCKFLSGPSRHPSTGTSSSGTSDSRRISLILPRRRARRRIRLCLFCTFTDIVTETALVSFRTLPVGFPLPTISKNSLYTLFCSLILDHGVLLKISTSGPKILISNFLLDTSLHHSFQSVIIKSGFLLMNIHIVQFQYGLELLRLSYS